MSPHQPPPLLRPLIVTGLGAAVLVGGCTLPFGATGVTVSSETQTDSLKASIGVIKENVKALNGSAQSGLKSVSAFSAANGAASSYRTQGDVTENGNTLVWSDATKQLTGFVGPEVNLAFDFTGKGKSHRTAKVSIQNTPDGTTGSLLLDVDAEAWSTPTQAPRYEIWYNSLPSGKITAASVQIALVPQGKSEQALDVTFGASKFEEFEVPTIQVPGLSSYALLAATAKQRIPTEISWKGFLPKIAFDQKLTLKKGGSDLVTLTWSGAMTLETPKHGKQDWIVNVSGDGTLAKPLSNEVTFLFENTTQKFKYTGKMTPKTETMAVLTGTFVSTVDDKQLATLSFDPSAGDTAPTITYADGTTERLALE